MQQAFSLQLLMSQQLPAFDQAPGPLHTVLQDENGDIYYSDEINHSLVSLDLSGGVRWHKTKRGQGPGELLYPKGIELGWIHEGRNRIRCISVCDSWNRRIQFFDRNGGYLATWDRAGNVPFRDVVDIRFLPAGHDSSTGPCWVVLDRGHSALFGLDPAGQVLFRFGRAFPENLESCWPTPCDSPDPQASPLDRFCGCVPYDPLFMPLRILGNAQQALFIWEPTSQRLKQVVSGNLIPVWLDLPPGFEWINADAQRLWSFDKSSSLLGTYNQALKSWCSVRIDGIPIPSSRFPNEVWLQNERSIHRWFWSDAAPGEKNDSHPWPLYTLQDEIEHALQLGSDSLGVNNLQNAIGRLREVGRKTLQIAAVTPDESCIEDLKSVSESSANALAAALSHARQFALFIFLSVLKIQALGTIYPSKDHQERARKALGRIEAAVKPIADLFEEVLFLRDDWLLSTSDLPARAASDPSGMLKSLCAQHGDVLLQAIRLFAKWQWAIPLADSILIPLETSAATLVTQRDAVCSWIPMERSPRTFGHKSKHFRELDRIFLGNPGSGTRVMPAVISYDPAVGFLVTLNNSGQIVRLNERGIVQGTITLPAGFKLDHPYGLAVENSGRIWISQPQCSAVHILDPGSACVRSLEDLAGRSLGLKCPTGLLITSTGQIHIADTHNNRILAAQTDGSVSILLDRVGKEVGEVRHPIGFCAAGNRMEFWIVDLRNHRLQRIDLNGNFLGAIGGPGLGKARMVLPESATMFSDGCLAVSQWAVNRVLKLFSPENEELDACQLDYSPRGILAHGSHLLVCDGYGDHIYVYERV